MGSDDDGLSTDQIIETTEWEDISDGDGEYIIESRLLLLWIGLSNEVVKIDSQGDEWLNVVSTWTDFLGGVHNWNTVWWLEHWQKTVGTSTPKLTFCFHFIIISSWIL